MVKRKSENNPLESFFTLCCKLQTVNISQNQTLDNIVKGFLTTEVEVGFNYVGGMSDFVFGDVCGK